MKNRFWRNKRVLITGHTGFKGSWLSLWLSRLGAEVIGYSLAPPTEPNLFDLCRIDQLIKSIRGDVRDLRKITNIMRQVKPEVVFHLAAQPIVRESYKVPVETFSTNVMGTVNLLEAMRHCPSVKALVNVTTDKVYENQRSKVEYQESDPLGGYDPYASSKACSELATQAYRRSYNLNVATTRAGNVIGGGDFAKDRLVPDFVRAILKGEPIRIRNPQAVRPWQYVLEPLAGYLLLAEKLSRFPGRYNSAWNFGPNKKDARPVEWLAKKLCLLWGDQAGYALDRGHHPHEADLLVLDASKAKQKLNWRPRWDLETGLEKIIDWTRAYQAGAKMRQVCFQQIKEYANE